MTTFLTEEASALIKVAGDFARNELGPRVAEYDRAEELPLDLLPAMAELGLFGGVVPVEFGGLGLDFRTYAQVIEEVSKTCNATAALLSMPSGLVGASILRFGTPEQKERWLVPLASGEMFGATAVTEPQSGSDVAGMQTTYRRDGSDFVLNGAKAWITNVNLASFVVSFATVDRSLGRNGVSAFILPRDTPGMAFRPYHDKLGFRPLTTGELTFDDVRLPEDALLGEEGRGFAVAMTAVERGRLGVAARAVGLAQAALDDSLSYANERQAFQRTISNYQIVQSKITDMVIGIETARLLVYEAADALQRGERARRLTSMAKMYASDVAFRTAADAIQIHGAYGVSPEFRVGRLLRDAKVLQIVEGSNDIHRGLIAEMSLGLRRSE
jgi:alkylation response protein AidB-like acyl-CoA dehydrogenase